MKHAFDVFRDHIEFKIHKIPGVCGLEIRMVFRVRNYPHGETHLVYFGDGQANAVYRY